MKETLTGGDIFLLILAIGIAMWIARTGFLWAVQLFRDGYEILTGKRRWDDD